MKRFLIAVAAMLALAGCGSSTSVKTVPGTKTVTAPFSIAGHACDKGSNDYFLQCALVNQPAPLPQVTTFRSKLGWDFAWSCPNPVTLKRNGKSFGASYFSPDPTKNWTRGCVDAYHRAGLATVGVWESTATRATQGRLAGISDARRAFAQARAVGMPANRPIDFAIDFDANGPEVAGYFAGVHSVLGSRGNAYGGIRPLRYLFNRGLVGHTNWQTFAWSFGAWLPANIAPLQQFTVGAAFDDDRAIAPDYGQWPFNTGPTFAQIKHWRSARDSSLRAYHARGCKLGTDKTHSCNVFADRVVYFQQKIWTKYSKFHCFGPHAQLKAAVCQILRPEVSHWSHARNTAQQISQNLLCGGLQHVPNDPRGICRILDFRIRWFSARIKRYEY